MKYKACMFLKKLYSNIILSIHKSKSCVKNNGIVHFLYALYWKLLNPFLINLKKRHNKIIKKDDVIIVSLTSYPARINTIHKCINSIINQTLKPDKIILWLAETQFQNKEKDLPQELLNLKSSLFSIRWCDDLKPHKKYFYSMQEFSGSVIITVDDDVYYKETLIEDLYSNYKKHPKSIICTRTHMIRLDKQGNVLPYQKWKREFYPLINRSRLDLLPIGVGGILYPPNILPKETFNKGVIQKTCINADDLWLKTMALLNNVSVFVIKSPFYLFCNYIENTQEQALFRTNVFENGNDIALKSILELYNNYYGTGDTLIRRIKKKYVK